VIVWNKDIASSEYLPEGRYGLWVDDIELGVILGCLQGVIENDLLQNNPDLEFFTLKTLGDLEFNLKAIGV